MDSFLRVAGNMKNNRGEVYLFHSHCLEGVVVLVGINFHYWTGDREILWVRGKMSNSHLNPLVHNRMV